MEKTRGAKKAETTPAANPLRERILDAAVRLLREEGIKALAQPRVAKAVGIPQGHLTYYFPKRTDLLLGVVRRTLDDAVAELAAFLGGADLARAGDDARERALAIAGHLVQNEARTRVMVGLLVEADADPALRETLIAKLGEMRALLALFFGREPGSPDVELLLAALWGVGLQRLLLGERRSAAETRALLARLVELFAPRGGAPAEPPPAPARRARAPRTQARTRRSR